MVAKKLVRVNPFADYGNIVTGERFIGRNKEVKEIHNRVLGNSYGNLAIIGLPRVGKSSLSWNALMTERTAVSKNNVIIDRINMGQIKTRDLFYDILVIKALENIKPIDSDMYLQLTEISNNLELFFAILKNEYRIIYILDEFDSVINIFKLEDFQLLRELSINPDTRICYVTNSRRTIQELEPHGGAISNFYGVFSDLRLAPFNKIDLEQYWDWVFNLGIIVSEEYKKEVAYYVGNHPFWLDMLNYYVFNSTSTTNNLEVKTLINIKESIKNDLWNQYHTTFKLMKHESLQSALIQVLLGPKLDVKQSEIEKLLKYGIISNVAAHEKYRDRYDGLMDANLINETDRYYTSISQHFNDYLKQIENEFDIWPLWTKTENLIRNTITQYLNKEFGEDWIDGFLEKNPKQKNNLDIIKKMRDKNIINFGEMASNDLVKYTYPLDMWNIFIMSDWNYFRNLFGGKSPEWQDKFHHLAKVRNPIAHSNQDFIIKEDIAKAITICEIIISKLEHLF